MGVYPIRDKSGRTVAWAADLITGWKHGKPVRIKRQSKKWTKRQAQLVYAEMKRKHEAGVDIQKKIPTTRAQVEAWFVNTFEPSHPGTSANTIKYAVKRIADHIGDIPVDKLTGARVRDLWTELRRKGLAVRTLDQTRWAGQAAFEFAIEDGLITKNPFGPKVAQVPGVRESIAKIITPEQARAFVRACGGHRLGLAVRFTLALGFRRMEAAGLRLEDLDLARGTLVVNGGLKYDPKLKLRYGATKTESGRRAFRLPPHLLEETRLYLARRAEEARAMGWEASDYLFVRVTDGGPIYPSYVYDAFKEIAKAAGLPDDLRLHDMRHSHASFLHAEGVPMKDISGALGHANTRITENLYVHLFGPAASDAAAAIDAMLGEDLTLELPGRKELNPTEP